MSDHTRDQSPQVGTPAWWDWYSTEGGGWERNRGREQTRLFAERFLRCVRLDAAAEFSLLDFGCALGDALAVFAGRCPKAKLSGVDVSQVAIARCRREFPGQATFWAGETESVIGAYDVIYTSNVLEHLPEWQETARQLLPRCRRLCIMVSFGETDRGRPLQPDPEHHHQHSSARKSFDYLRTEGLAARIAVYLVTCPGAWGEWRLKDSLL